MAGETETRDLMQELVSPPAGREQPIEGLVSGTVGDRCVSCGSLMSSDQRYCVICGERRGAPRFSLPAASAATPEAAPKPPRQPRRPRVGAGTTLVAGVATLLLALLVGVLIGHNTAGNGSRTVEAGPTKVIKINAGAAPAASTASTPASASSTGSSAKTSSKKHTGSKVKSTKKSSPPVSSKTAKQLSSAAAKVTGGAGAAPPTSTVGSSCSSGTAGCNKKTHKFTGTFFGG